MYRICILFLFLVSCIEEPDPIAEMDRRIRGEWEWISSKGLGYSEDPDKVGYTRKLKFISSESVEIYIDGTLDSTTSFELSHHEYPSGSTAVWLRVHGLHNGRVDVKQGILSFDATIYDGEYVSYQKVD